MSCSRVKRMVRKCDRRDVIKTSRKTIKPRGGNQSAYTEAISTHDVHFGIGPAGTGKTYLAVACAVEALESQRVNRILLVRPAVEAGEKLGFLPGDLAQKIDPYLRPLYDALYEMMGVERVNKYIERNIIEVAPLAYMRGRTLNNAFIILDESQNTTVAQMKMFLTRIGFGSTAVITGDVTQIDLPAGRAIGSGQRGQRAAWYRRHQLHPFRFEGCGPPSAGTENRRCIPEFQRDDGLQEWWQRSTRRLKRTSNGYGSGGHRRAGGRRSSGRMRDHWNRSVGRSCR